MRDSRPRRRTTSPAASRCRTRSGSTPPTVSRGRCTSCSATSSTPPVSSGPSSPVRTRCAARRSPSRRPAAVDRPRPRAEGHRRGAGYEPARGGSPRAGGRRPAPAPPLRKNSTATAGALVALILAFGSVSGAHFNPVVSLADRWFGGLSNRDLGGYVGAQVVGGCLGAIAANLMFDLDAVNVSTKVRSGADLWFAEVIATLGLLLVIFGVVRAGRPALAPFAV